MRDERDMVGTLHPGVNPLLPIPKHQLLDHLAEHFGTDKGSSGHNYTPLYANLFQPHRYEPLTLLELGIWKGASLRMWRAYFPNATIIGLDRDPTKANLSGTDAVGLEGDQNDRQVIDHIASLYGPLHIIIDDASHISSKTIRSFELLWPHLAPGGIYVIEDLQTSYDPANYGTGEASYDPDWNPEDPFGLTMTAMQFCKRLADEVNAGLYPEKYRRGFDVTSVYFEANICVITKKGKWSTK